MAMAQSTPEPQLSSAESIGTETFVDLDINRTPKEPAKDSHNVSIEVSHGSTKNHTNDDDVNKVFIKPTLDKSSSEHNITAHALQFIGRFDRRNATNDTLPAVRHQSRAPWSWLPRAVTDTTFDVMDMIVAVAATTAILLAIVSVSAFLGHCVKHRRHYAPGTGDTCIYGYDASLALGMRKRTRFYHCDTCSSSRSSSTCASVRSASSMGGTMEMGTQYDCDDVMIPSFVSEDLIVELNDRDSTCTSVSDGFTYCDDYSSSPNARQGVTEL